MVTKKLEQCSGSYVRKSVEDELNEYEMDEK